MKDKVKNIAEAIFKSMLLVSADHQGTFRLLITAKLDNDVEKPLLILGVAHSAVEDGHCIAILNPDEDLQDKVIAGCAYGNSLKTIVQGKCDLMLNIWIDAYKKDGVCIIDSYQANIPKPSKFNIK